VSQIGTKRGGEIGYAAQRQKPLTPPREEA